MSEERPNSWSEFILLTIRKKKPMEECKNYRPISFINHPSTKSSPNHSKQNQSSHWSCLGWSADYIGCSKYRSELVTSQYSVKSTETTSNMFFIASQISKKRLTDFGTRLSGIPGQNTRLPAIWQCWSRTCNVKCAVLVNNINYSEWFTGLFNLFFQKIIKYAIENRTSVTVLDSFTD